MICIRHAIIILCLSATVLNVSGQDNPPAPAMPAESTTVLIDRIIKVTNHEQYFTDYCSKRILAYAEDHNWTKQKTSEILQSAKFDNYKSTIYNSYAFYSASQLAKLLDTLEDISKTTRPRQMFILTNPMMQNNLDLFVKSVIEGKYLTR